MQRDLHTLSKEQRVNLVLLEREGELGLVKNRPWVLSRELRLGSETLKATYWRIMA